MAEGESWTVISYQVGLGRDKDYNSAAYIHCWCGEQRKVSIFFIQPEFPLPDNTYDDSEKQMTLFVPAEQFSWYTDVLRNEKPVEAWIYTDKPKWSKLRTFLEPTGEAE